MAIGVRALLALAVLSTAAIAADVASADSDPMADYYGNTLITRDGGYVSHFYYKPDHTFSGKVPAYMFEFQGTWQQMPDGSICRIFNPPLPRMKNPDCGPLLVHRLGDKENEPNGDAEKLVLGIQ
ncbi:MAG: hypothetical protein P4L57_09505 [Rhizomicrobium sp.]|nr:hypothetical protein [Rhizomicrobium sp.]